MIITACHCERSEAISAKAQLFSENPTVSSQASKGVCSLMIARNSIKKSILASFWFILIGILPVLGAFGAIFNDPGVPDGEQFVWQVTREGVKFSPTIITWRVSSRDGKQVYKITEDAGDRKQAKFVIGKSDLRLIRAQVDRINEKGESKISVNIMNDCQYLTYIEGEKKPKRKKIGHRQDGYNGLVLPHCLKGFPFETRKEVEIRLTPPFRPGVPFWAWKMWKSYARYLGTEKVTVPAGTFDCYKLEVGASGGIIKRVTSKYYFWFAKEPPYQFIKYQDKDGKNVTELIEIRPNSAE